MRSLVLLLALGVLTLGVLFLRRWLTVDGPGPGAGSAAAPAEWPVSFTLRDAPPAFDRVLLVTIDTLRADHVSSHGYPRRTTPWLDRIAERGVLFERAMAAVSHTAPSHATMLTGLTPLEHGVEQNGHQLPDGARDLGRLFREAGFDTGAFLNVKFLRGVATSFDHVAVDTNARPLVDAATAWIAEEREGDRFFLWLHLYGPHRWKEDERTPTRTLAELEAEDTLDDDALFAHLRELHGLPAPDADGRLPLDWNAAVDGTERVEAETVADYVELIDRYDAQTRHTDKLVESLYDALEALDLPGRTLWIVTSDHGEGLASHGVAGHGSRIYQEQLHVPLVFHATDGSLGPARVERLVQHVDLFPTLAEALGAAVRGVDPALHGASLLPLLEGRTGWSDRPAFSQRRPLGDETKGARARNEGELYALQSDRYKYLLHEPGADEFYDLALDPLELENLIERSSPERDALRSLLEARIELYRAARLSDGDVEVPDEWMEELRALGYVE